MIASLASLFRCSLIAFLIAGGVPALAQSSDGGQQASSSGAEPAIKDPRSRAKLHTELGSLYFQQGNIPVAMEELTVAIYIDKTYAPAYSMRALVHNYLKEPEYADNNFQDALRYAPDDPEIANNYGWFLCQNNRGEEAMPQFERALRNRMYQTPDRAYLNAGQCLLRMGKLPEAREYLDQAFRSCCVRSSSTIAAGCSKRPVSACPIWFARSSRMPTRCGWACVSRTSWAIRNRK